MDRNLTEIPRSLCTLYQRARAALQRILLTEAKLLPADVTKGPDIPSKEGSGPPTGPADVAAEKDGENHGGGGTLGAGDPGGLQERAGAAEVGHDEEGGEREFGEEVAGSGAGVAACACGRPLLLGTSDGWLRVPAARHSRARRTVSGKKRCVTSAV